MHCITYSMTIASRNHVISLQQVLSDCMRSSCKFDKVHISHMQNQLMPNLFLLSHVLSYSPTNYSNVFNLSDYSIFLASSRPQCIKYRVEALPAY